MDPAARAVARILGDRVRSFPSQIVDPKGRPLSQEAFAERAGLDRAYVERGTANVTIYTMVRIAQTLEIDPSALVEGLRP